MIQLSFILLHFEYTLSYDTLDEYKLKGKSKKNYAVLSIHEIYV